LLSGGDAGSLAELEAALPEPDAVLDELDPEAVLDELADPLLEDAADDLVEVENVTTDDTVAVILPDADAADDCIALLSADTDAEGVACEGCHALVDNGHSQFDCVGVTSTFVVCGGAVGHAVSGPNSTIK
jgi:hypothetical protein